MSRGGHGGNAMAVPDDDEISPYLQQTPRSKGEVERQREERQIQAQRQRQLDHVVERLSRDQLRFEASLLTAESRRTEDPERRELLAGRAFELAQLAERREPLPSEPPAAPPMNANENVNRMLDQARRWRMRAEEYRTIAAEMHHPIARGSYLHLARTYETLAGTYEERAHSDHLLRSLRSP